MPRLIAVLLISACAILAACGGDKKPAAGTDGDREPAAAPTATAEAEPTATAAVDSGGAGAGGVLSLLFDNALGGAAGGLGAGAAGLGQGDEALKAYLLQPADLPDGYTPFGQFTFRLEEGVSEYGAADMAASMAASGDLTGSAAPDSFGMLMSMVIRFDDLQDLESAFGDLDGLSEEDLQDALGQAGEELASAFSDIELLDVSGLGDNAMGLRMTLDISALAGAFGAPATGDAPGAITMHMYFFGRGQYAGALFRMGAGSSLPADVDELALARLIDSRLAAAP